MEILAKQVTDLFEAGDVADVFNSMSKMFIDEYAKNPDIVGNTIMAKHTAIGFTGMFMQTATILMDLFIEWSNNELAQKQSDEERAHFITTVADSGTAAIILNYINFVRSAVQHMMQEGTVALEEQMQQAAQEGTH